MELERQQLSQLLEETWAKGYARGILKQSEKMDEDILEVIGSVATMIKAKRTLMIIK